jgi:hypothetical protein
MILKKKKVTLRRKKKNLIFMSTETTSSSEEQQQQQQEKERIQAALEREEAKRIVNQAVLDLVGPPMFSDVDTDAAKSQEFYSKARKLKRNPWKFMWIPLTLWAILIAFGIYWHFYK